jgi:hypothetical protein
MLFDSRMRLHDSSVDDISDGAMFSIATFTDLNNVDLVLSSTAGLGSGDYFPISAKIRPAAMRSPDSRLGASRDST